MEIKGTLKSIDQYLNLKLDNIKMISDESKYPHLLSIRNLFIRGSNIRYIHLNPNSIDTNLLQDASRRGMSHIKIFNTDLSFILFSNTNNNSFN